MKTTWWNGLDQQGEKDIKSSFKAATRVRERLSEICNNKIDTSLSTTKKQYDNPNWAYMQADNLGYRRALEEIISLLEE